MAPERRRDQPPPRTGSDSGSGSGSGEKDVLTGFLTYLRESVLAKVDGVPEPEVRTPGVPSGTNLLGLVKHLAHVERAVFLGEHVRSWPATFHAGPDETVASVVQDYRDAIAAADRAVAACPGLEHPSHTGRRAPSMRWALTHLIEETGRHAGHLDILRELIDGRTGR